MNSERTASRGRADILWLLLALGLVNLPYFAPSFLFMPAHDTMSCVQQFFFIYNEYFLHGEIPLWQPYNIYGCSIECQIPNTMSPALWFTALAGRAFGATDALFLFKLAVLVEQAALLVGVYLLGRQLFTHRAPVLLAGIGAVATTFWGLQLYFNFRLYYLVPLVVFFIVRYHDTRDAKYAFAAALGGLLSLLGNAIYFVPLYLLLYGVFAAALFIRTRRNPLPRARTPFRPTALVLLAAFAVLAAALLLFSRNGMNFTMGHSRGRDSLSQRVPLELFLTYGPTPADPVPLSELIYAAPASPDATLFIGLIPLIFVAYALVYVRGQPVLDALLLTAAAVLLLSLSQLTCLAPLAYVGFPLFDYFRHLGPIRPAARILLLIAAAFGFDRWLDAPRRPAFLRAGMVLLALILLTDLFGVAALSRVIPYPPAFSSPLATPTSFHIVDVLLVIALLAMLARGLRDTAHPPVAAVTVLYSLEILSYAYLLFLTSPAKVPMPRQAPLETVAAYDGRVARLASSFRVRPYEFQEQRLSKEDARQAMDQSFPVATQYEGGKYSTVYSAAYVDPCIQDQRTHYLQFSVDRLLRARLNIPLDQPLADETPIPDETCTDAALLRALGCGTPKLFLASKVEIAKDLETAAKLVRESEDFDRVPVILTGTPPTNAAAPVRGTLGDVRVADFTADRVEVHADVTAPQGAWLVYLDAFHPDWTARVNGRPVPIAAANLAFKAVRLDAGMNVVELVFRGHRGSRLCVATFFTAGVASVLVLAGAILRLLFGREQAKPA